LLRQRKADIYYYDPFVKEISSDDHEYSGIKKISWIQKDIRSMDGAIIVTDHDGIDWKLLLENTLVYDTRGVKRKLSHFKR
jgi:UDP-N-acetyl-D-glucosamine dehydrogenase